MGGVSRSCLLCRRLIAVWDYERTGVKEFGEKAGGLICVKRTESDLEID